jgi:hypothetical protein
MEDGQILKHIKDLTEEEKRLYAQRHMNNPDDLHRLHKMNVELDQCWDLLRQRRALRDASANPDVAAVRPESVVENFKP